MVAVVVKIARPVMDSRRGKKRDSKAFLRSNKVFYGLPGTTALEKTLFPKKECLYNNREKSLKSF